MRTIYLVVLSTLSALVASTQAPQERGGPENELIRQGAQLDWEGQGAAARAVFQKAIDSAPTSAAKANAQRAMAMSWAFEGNCQRAAEYEERVIDYWKTQEQQVPATAFYQEGEMADEAARVCLDHGELNMAYDLYKSGHDLGVKEPNLSPGRKDLWEYRWEHAQARIAARRGNKTEAEKHVTAAKGILSDLQGKDPKLYEQQNNFLPYLTGYVALYTGEAQAALADLQNANQKDAFIQCLIGMAYEKLGDTSKAMEAYHRAAEVHGHNPPVAFAGPFARKKLGQS